jgi:hypothetical protein
MGHGIVYPRGDDVVNWPDHPSGVGAGSGMTAGPFGPAEERGGGRGHYPWLAEKGEMGSEDFIAAITACGG